MTGYGRDTVAEPPHNGDRRGAREELATPEYLELLAERTAEQVLAKHSGAYAYAEDEIDLMDYISPLAKWRWGIALIAAACAIIAALISTPSGYTATAHVSWPTGPVVEKIERAGEIIFLKDNEQFKSFDILVPLVHLTYADSTGATRELRYAWNKEGDAKKAAETLVEKLTVRSGNKNNAGGNITAEIEHHEPGIAAATVNAYIGAFIGYKRAPWRKALENLEKAKAELSVAQTKLLSSEQHSSGVAGTPSAIIERATLTKILELLEERYYHYREQVDAYESEFSVDIRPLYADPNAIPAQSRYARFPKKQAAIGAIAGLMAAIMAAFAAEYIARADSGGQLRESWSNGSLRAVLRRLFCAVR